MVNAGDTDFKVPDAIVYINTVIALGKLGKKRKRHGVDYTGHFS